MVAISEMAKPMSQQVLTVEKRNEEGEKQETISQPSSDKAIITVEKTEENVEKKFDIYRNLMFVFMVATLSFYVFVNAFWYHIVCNVLIFVTSTISFTFSVLYLKKEKDWFVQIVAPVMFLLMIISLKSF